MHGSMNTEFLEYKGKSNNGRVGICVNVFFDFCFFIIHPEQRENAVGT